LLVKSGKRFDHRPIYAALNRSQLDYETNPKFYKRVKTDTLDTAN